MKTLTKILLFIACFTVTSAVIASTNPDGQVISNETGFVLPVYAVPTNTYFHSIQRSASIQIPWTQLQSACGSTNTSCELIVVNPENGQTTATINVDVVNENFLGATGNIRVQNSSVIILGLSKN